MNFKALTLSLLLLFGWYCASAQITFLDPVVVYQSNTFVTDLQSGDADGDGDVDIFYRSGGHVSSADDGTFWLENDGGGNFTNRTTIDSDFSSGGLLVVDIDNDNDVDAVVENKIYKNDGNGNFTLHQTMTSTFPRAYAFYDKAMAYGEIDANPSPDLLYSGLGLSNPQFADSLFWYKNDGNGTFNQKELVGLLPDSNQIAGIQFISGDIYVLLVKPLFNGNFDVTFGWFESDNSGGFWSFSAIDAFSSIGSFQNRRIDIVQYGYGGNDVVLIFEGDYRYYQNNFNTGGYSYITSSGVSSDIDGDFIADFSLVHEGGFLPFPFTGPIRAVEIIQPASTAASTVTKGYASWFPNSGFANPIMEILDADNDGDDDFIIASGSSLFTLHRNMSDTTVSGHLFYD